MFLLLKEQFKVGDYFSKKYPDFETAWNKYITQNENGTVSINGDLDTVKENLTNLISEYKKLAATSALTNLAEENQEAIIGSQKEINNAAIAYREAQQELQDFKDEWDLTDAHLKTLQDVPDFYTWQNKNSTKNSYAGDLKKQYIELTSKLNDAESEFNKASEGAAQLKQNSSDLASMQAVVNGNYKDASAVLMAYNSGLITTEDIQNSQWKSLTNLQSAAKESGKNLVFGMSTGVSSYLDEVKKSALNTADMYLSSLDEGFDSHSPSRETKKRGIWLIEGLINGILEKIQEPVNIIKRLVDKILSPIQQIAGKIKEKIDPIKDVFRNAFNGIWATVKQPLNWLMEKMEGFINGFIGGINEMLSGVDWAVNSVGNLFGQEWHTGKLQKITLPRFAKGGIVKAPTLALVGDNAGASTGDPEVISPLSKLQGMIDNSSNSYDTEILKQILSILKKMYEMFLIFQNNGGNMYEFVAKLNGTTLFDEMVRQNDLYKKRHNGKSAFL